eukprot:3689970-Ditylum_brightwellii.AAC.1
MGGQCSDTLTIAIIACALPACPFSQTHYLARKKTDTWTPPTRCLHLTPTSTANMPQIYNTMQHRQHEEIITTTAKAETLAPALDQMKPRLPHSYDP